MIFRTSRMPRDLLQHFVNREHVMRHQPGIWNAIWSDMMIETTVMRYGHGPHGMTGITLNPKAVQQWALSWNISCQLQNDLLDLKEHYKIKDVTTHKEESPSRIKADEEDRANIHKMLTTSIYFISKSRRTSWWHSDHSHWWNLKCNCECRFSLQA